ncbi:hypothetical protein NS331_08840 [Pseudacidovorax intermedius]|uniref:Uncharacterized protein n=1 Tax=Pseudacidovorax intermedius TaxID=433924 RepID=A0A147H045_9BURK|nr:hypothetical protein NS331_08840 [Pseudacidovorax intermedius]
MLAGGTAFANPAHAPAAAAAPGGYAGPSSVPVSTVRQLLDSGRDDQQVRLQGRIVSHDGGKHYTFADDSGRIPVEIKARHFPPGRTVGAEQRVELHGEFEKGRHKTEVEVERLVVLN